MVFRVEDLHDLVRLLEERPEWRAELRRLVLTEDLLAMPARQWMTPEAMEAVRAFRVWQLTDGHVVAPSA